MMIGFAIAIFLFNALVALGGREYGKAAAFGFMAILFALLGIWNAVCGLSSPNSELRSPDSDSSSSSRPPQPPCNPLSDPGKP